MKKKWLQRIISMVLAVGMLMPSVGAYAEIIDHPTNYKTATSMPMYDNSEIQITEGEYIVEEIVDGSEISSLSNQVVVIDEAHKLMDGANQMYGKKISEQVVMMNHLKNKS